MKTDTALSDEVTAELRWEPSVSSGGISVAARDGIVTLRGSVPHFAEKVAAEESAQRVKGVKALVDELTVDVSGERTRTDAQIAEAVVHALAWHVWVPDTVHAAIENGWVRLTGTATWDFERQAADGAVRYLAAVRGVSNDIRLEPGVPPDAVRDAVQKALRRDADVDANHIDVSSEAGRVTLSGTVTTSRERDLAGSAACNVPGVRSVGNNLAVSS
jgi:osmotically-inducible protein OsmY